MGAPRIYESTGQAVGETPFRPVDAAGKMEVDMNRALLSPRGIALAFILAGAALAAPMPIAAQVTVNVGGQPLYLNPGPIERAGRVFVPLRSIFERLGASVVYQSGTINATRAGQGISLQIGSTQATVNGQIQYLDVAPFIVGATTYVPLRFVAQSFGSNVGYDSSTQVVSISMPHGGGGHYVPPPVHPIPPPNPPPVSIVRLVAQQPPPGANVVNRFVTLSADFSNQVNPGSVRVWLDGADVTSRCNVSRASIAYRPPAPLAFGGHTVRVAGVDAGGSRFDRSWSFNVSGAPPPPGPQIQLRALQPADGATVANAFVTISAQFTRPVQTNSVIVRLDGGDITSRCGISGSAFSYKPPAPLSAGSHRVRVTGRGNDGTTFDRSWSFSVSRATPPKMTLNITQPAANASVGRNFVIRGNTVANGRIQVTAGAGPAGTGQFSGTAAAGAGGVFTVRVSLSPLMGQQAVRVKITATDPITSQSVETTLQLLLNQ
jgi:Copper amine oxidase N-terminal domain/Bacterial Ig domain